MVYLACVLDKSFHRFKTVTASGTMSPSMLLSGPRGSSVARATPEPNPYGCRRSDHEYSGRGAYPALIELEAGRPLKFGLSPWSIRRTGASRCSCGSGGHSMRSGQQRSKGFSKRGATPATGGAFRVTIPSLLCRRGSDQGREASLLRRFRRATVILRGSPCYPTGRSASFAFSTDRLKHPAQRNVGTAWVPS